MGESCGLFDTLWLFLGRWKFKRRKDFPHYSHWQPPITQPAAQLKNPPIKNYKLYKERQIRIFICATKKMSKFLTLETNLTEILEVFFFIDDGRNKNRNKCKISFLNFAIRIVNMRMLSILLLKWNCFDLQLSSFLGLERFSSTV